MINFKQMREILNSSSTYETALFLFDLANTQEKILESWLRKEKRLHTMDDMLEFVERLKCIE